MFTDSITQNWLTPRQAAEYLGLTERALNEWRRTGKGPAYVRLSPTNGRVRYERATLDAFMRARLHAHTTAESTR